MQALEVEREAVRRLPAILAELFDEPETVRPIAEPSHGGVDVVADAGGRRWLFEVKSSSSPGVVASAARQLAALQADGSIPVLVVPYMSAAGARTADERGLNWIDLSGNAHLRDDRLHIRVQGRANAFPPRGRPSSAFAPRSSRVARALLLDPSRWWRQKELSEHTDLDTGRVSRIVARLAGDELLDQDGARLRPRDPDLLLDAWSDAYRFDRHDIIVGHMSGAGIELARAAADRLGHAEVDHAFTGLPAAYAYSRFARYRLVSIYVAGDPRDAADVLDLRRNERGANVQLIGPDDPGVLDGRRSADGLLCAAPIQVYLDLLHLPERAREAAQHLRAEGALWNGGA